MEAILNNNNSAIRLCISSFLAVTARKHKLNVDKLLAEWKAFVYEAPADDDASGEQPKRVASKISDLESESSENSEVKAVLADDSEDNVTKPTVVDTEEDSDEAPVKGVASEDGSDSESAPVKKTKAKPAETKVKKTKGKAAAAEDSEGDEASEAPVKPKTTKKAAPKTKKGKAAPVEDDEDASEAKTKRGETKVKGKPAAKKTTELVLSDTPKLAAKERPEKMPKGVQYVKGTNNIVKDGKVVAALTKTGVVPLKPINTKALDAKGTAYDVWDEAKIKKVFKL